MTKNWKRFTTGIKLIFFWSKVAIFFSQGLLKERPSYRRSLQHQNRTSSISKHKISFSIFVGHLRPPGFGSGFGIYWPDWIRIQFGSGSETLVTFVPSCEDWKWCSRNEVNNTSDCILNKSGAFLRISPHTVKGFPVLLAPHSKKNIRHK